MTWSVCLRRSLRCLLFAAAVVSLNITSVLAQQLEVVDANGIKIGVVDSIQSFNPVIAFNLDGRWFSLTVLQSGFAANTQLGFETFDCSGTRFLINFGAVLGTSVMFSPVAIAPSGNTVFLPVSNSTSEPRTLNSTMSREGACSPLTQPVEAQVFPAQAIEDLNSRFTPPFTLQTTLQDAGP
jgi:hypothetical protein